MVNQPQPPPSISKHEEEIERLKRELTELVDTRMAAADADEDKSNKKKRSKKEKSRDRDLEKVLYCNSKQGK